mmetsp:Transcript_24/g.57  ORF Transcript_24/g.57 Transcript_24/m.57 type:complete len:252 (+) Transcript_24:796-1551(+)
MEGDPHAFLIQEVLQGALVHVEQHSQSVVVDHWFTIRSRSATAPGVANVVRLRLEEVAPGACVRVQQISFRQAHTHKRCVSTNFVHLPVMLALFHRDCAHDSRNEGWVFARHSHKRNGTRPGVGRLLFVWVHLNRAPIAKHSQWLRLKRYVGAHLNLFSRRGTVDGNGTENVSLLEALWNLHNNAGLATGHHVDLRRCEGLVALVQKHIIELRLQAESESIDMQELAIRYWFRGRIDFVRWREIDFPDDLQ